MCLKWNTIITNMLDVVCRKILLPCGRKVPFESEVLGIAFPFQRKTKDAVQMESQADQQKKKMEMCSTLCN